MAIFLALILAAGVCIFGFRSFIGIDVFELWKKGEHMSNTEETSSEFDTIKIATLQEQSDKDKIKDRRDFSFEEVAIVNKYQNTLLAMEKAYETKIDDLVLKAITEYKGLSKQEKKDAMLTLGLKYLNFVTVLEQECDRSFDTVLEEMKYELEKDNLSIDILIDVKNQYEQGKSERREVFMEKFLNH